MLASTAFHSSLMCAWSRSRSVRSWALLGESIGAAQAAGFVAIALGIVVAARAESR